MKKIIITICLSLFTIGCAGNDVAGCYLSVKEKYDDVYFIPDIKYTFLAIKDKKLFVVRTMNITDTEITSEYEMPIFVK